MEPWCHTHTHRQTDAGTLNVRVVDCVFVCACILAIIQSFRYKVWICSYVCLEMGVHDESVFELCVCVCVRALPSGAAGVECSVSFVSIRQD